MGTSKDDLLALSGAMFSPAEREERRHMLFADIQAKMAEANRREDAAWAGLRTVAGWEAFRDARIAALRASLGAFPAEPDHLDVEVTGEVAGDAYRIRKLLFETRPGVLVTAHLYVPDPPRGSMPGIQIVHAHHRPKEQAELQDMGVNWSRTGSVVLVPDLLGHGERGEQPFGGRQDYYSRYFMAMQLHLAGESLIGWMVWDLMRGLDVLLRVPGIDPDRVLLVGAVAGGGDPAAVVAALDRRVTGCVPFNFGRGSAWRTDLGTPAPDGENLAGYSYWECTRNLRLSARDGFFPWVIVSAAAPNPLVSAHEFAWDAETDEAWHRMQQVYELYGASDRLGWSKGAGRCAPGAGNTHCTNVGPVHRAGVYPYLCRWFRMPAPDPEVEERREPEDLACLTDEAASRRRPLRDLCAELASERLAAAREARAKHDPDRARALLREGWRGILGDTGPRSAPEAEVRRVERVAGVRREGLILTVEAGVVVPAILLVPDGAAGPVPAVVCVCQQGKGALLQNRADDVAGLLAEGIAVFLPDVRGTGETRPGDLRGCESRGVRASMDELMLGRTLLGLQLADLGAAVRYLDERDDVDTRRLALWGDSTAPLNPPGFEVPEQNGKRVDDPEDWPDEPYGPAVAEPMGGLVALLGALFDDRVRAALVRRGLVAFASAFSSYYFYIPADCVVPGALTVGDIPDVAAGLAPRALRLEGLVSACNGSIDQAELEARFAPARGAYAGRPDRLELHAGIREDAPGWLARALGDSV